MSLRGRSRGAHVTWVAGSRIGRFVFRRQIAEARRSAMTVVAGATLAGLVVLVLAAERERARD